jgi:hypothetical protein
MYLGGVNRGWGEGCHGWHIAAGSQGMQYMPGNHEITEFKYSKK